MLNDPEDMDCAMRALNGVALAKNCLLAGNVSDAMRHIDAALSWSVPLLGAEHPMTLVADHVLQPPLLNHEDTSRLGRSIETPNDL